MLMKTIIKINFLTVFLLAFNVLAGNVTSHKTINFVIVGDTHSTGNIPAIVTGNVPAIVKRINKLDPQPAFVMFIGDIAGADSDPNAYKDMVAFEKLCKNLRAPHYYTLGNHEAIKVSLKRCSWQQIFKVYNLKERWYSFDVGDFHICVLDGFIGMNSKGYGSNAGKAMPVLDP